MPTLIIYGVWHEEGTSTEGLNDSSDDEKFEYQLYWLKGLPTFITYTSTKKINGL